MCFPCVFRVYSVTTFYFTTNTVCQVVWRPGGGGAQRNPIYPFPRLVAPPPSVSPPSPLFPHFEISMALSQILMHLIIKFYSVCLSVIKIQIFQSLFPSEARNHVSEARMPPQGLEFLNSSILVF